MKSAGGFQSGGFVMEKKEDWKSKVEGSSFMEARK